MTAAGPIPLPLRPARVHEASGPGATSFAVITFAQNISGQNISGSPNSAQPNSSRNASTRNSGPLLWLRESWLPGMLDPAGLAPLVDPAHILLTSTRNQTDTLAVAEEALRDGAVGLVVAEITRPLDLREGRRLQLAAKAGRTTGLCLIPEGMGSPAAETRWLCTPVFDPAARSDSTLMRWQIIKNKKGTLGVWHVRWNPAAHRLDVVSPVVQRPGPASLSG